MGRTKPEANIVWSNRIIPEMRLMTVTPMGAPTFVTTTMRSRPRFRVRVFSGRGSSSSSPKPGPPPTPSPSASPPFWKTLTLAFAHILQASKTSGYSGARFTYMNLVSMGPANTYPEFCEKRRRVLHKHHVKDTTHRCCRRRRRRGHLEVARYPLRRRR